MKVGIISMQRVHNYGSFLQAYSLKKNIESLGHKCEFIDIKPGKKIVSQRKKEKINYLSKFDKYFLKRVRHYFFSKNRNKNFEKTYYKWLGLSEENNWEKKYDLVIIGSDEVFNCTQGKWGLSPNLFGADINADKIVTYATSCGYTTYEKIKELGVEEKISNFLSNIDIFSVRDKNTFEFIKKLTDKNSLFHLDPVFIYNFDDEIKERKLKHNYVLVYAYSGRIKDKREITAIQQYAKKNNLKTVSAGLYQSWCDKNISVDPFELLGYVKNARYVITDTFHGTVFSIKYNKPFATIIRDSNKQKISYLLKFFNLTKQEVLDMRKLPNILEQDVDYKYINKLITEDKEKSLEYLKKNLSIK